MNQREMRRLLLPTAGLLGFAGIAQAQTDLYTINGVSAEDKAGTAVSSAGLFSADMNPDIIVGSPENFIIFTADEGKATIHDGPTGSVLNTFDGDNLFDEFGAAVFGGFDFNNDGRDDVIVGAPFDNNTANSSGMARVFSGMTGGMLFQVDGDAMGDELGRAVGAADVNDDGFDDIIVGSLNSDAGAVDGGIARVYSGANQSVLWTVTGTGNNDHVGAAVAGLGDLNGDGNEEFAVGSFFDGVRVINGATGGVFHFFPNTSNSDLYGVAVANAGDVDGDLINDIIIGATQDSALSPGTGFAQVRSGATGALIHTLTGSGIGDRFGISVDGAGDVNDDGFADVIVGADQDGTGANGYARVFDGLTGLMMFDITSANPANNIQLGHAVAGLGDVNGNGSLEVAAGAPLESTLGLGRGHVRVVSGPAINVGCPTPTNYCIAGVNSSGTQSFISWLGSTSIADNNFNLTASGATPSTFGIFFYSDGQLPGLPIVGSPGVRCIGGMASSGVFRTPITAINGGGNAFRNVDFTSPNLSAGPGAIVAGVQINWQFFYRDVDPTVPIGFTTSDALSVTFCP